jgi:hypothetical protein
MDRILTEARQILKAQHADPRELAGRCFQATRALSQFLIDQRVRHQVTVGNVHVARKPYYEVTRESLARDMEEGFTHAATAAHAHTWITLTDGTVIDGTIIPTLAKKLGRRVKWIEAFIADQGLRNWGGYPIKHVPMLQGLDYYRRVVIPQGEGDLAGKITVMVAKGWSERLDEVNSAT